MANNNTCPFPININPLSPNGFVFRIQKLDTLTYFCQDVQLPGVSLGTATQATPFQQIAQSGDILTFDSLTVQFLVDEQMSNYRAVLDWLFALGKPDNFNEYSDFIGRFQNSTSEATKQASDGVLQILGSSNNPVASINFRDLLPTRLESLQFSSSNTGVNYLVGSATFAYTGFTFA